MLKILIILAIVHHAMPIEYLLARMRVLVEKNPLKNHYIRVEKIRDNYAKGNSTQNINFIDSCMDQETLDVHHKVDEFVFGEDLKLSWLQEIETGRFRKIYLRGYLSIKYKDKRYNDVYSEFDLCNMDINSKADGLGSYIFQQIFIQGYVWFYGCVEPKSVNINDKLYINNGDMREGIHCDTDATLRIDLREKVDADCGIGGSGESFIYNTFRVIFNARFENCDGKKYDFLKGLNKATISNLKASMAKDTIMEIATNPIIH